MRPDAIMIGGSFAGLPTPMYVARRGYYGLLCPKGWDVAAEFVEPGNTRHGGSPAASRR
jgi:hypothetical protein